MNTQTTKITDLSIDILRMINQNTKYIRNKKKLNQELKIAFSEIFDLSCGDDSDLYNLFRHSKDDDDTVANIIIEIEDEYLRRNGGEYYTPRAVTQFMVDITALKK